MKMGLRLLNQEESEFGVLGVLQLHMTVAM